jgi:DNA-binding LacI/PurR family transcriptional regulator
MPPACCASAGTSGSRCCTGTRRGAGHLAAEAALRSAGGLVLQRAGHDGTPAAAARTLEALFGAGTPPTALVVTEPGTAITAITWLARRGLRVPSRCPCCPCFMTARWRP